MDRSRLEKEKRHHKEVKVPEHRAPLPVRIAVLGRSHNTQILSQARVSEPILF